MSLNVLLADDSVPAQNMAKKILVDAGYEVLAVSNGLEAIRKIADSVPDIAILDIFMPGYTGLEICEKLRANPATASLPVILTVGKLEPYRPEDGEHVHSNAIIVKPFAAAELISAVRSLVGAPADQLPEPAVVAPVLAPAPADEPLAANDDPLAGQVDELDEPLFFYEAGAPSSTSGAPVAPAAELPEAAPSDGPESLVFNPDAGHTPFSASTAPEIPAEPQAESPVAETQVTEQQVAEPQNSAAEPFSDFDLAPAESPYSAEPDPGILASGDSPFSPSPSADESPLGEQPSPQYAALDEAQLDSFSAPEPVQLQSSIAPEPVPAAPEAPSEPAAALDIPTLDPLFEESQSVSPEVPATEEVTATDEVTAPDNDNPLGAATEDSPFGEESNEPLSPDEEARRRAFEELFNSNDPLPLDEPATHVANVALPSLAEPSRDQVHIAPDTELESPFDDHLPVTASEPDPFLISETPVESSAPATATDSDLFLESSSEPTPWSVPQQESEPVSTQEPFLSAESLKSEDPFSSETIAANASEFDSAFGTPADLQSASPLDFAPEEALPVIAEEQPAELLSEKSSLAPLDLPEPQPETLQSVAGLVVEPEIEAEAESEAQPVAAEASASTASEEAPLAPETEQPAALDPLSQPDAVQAEAVYPDVMSQAIHPAAPQESAPYQAEPVFTPQTACALMDSEPESHFATVTELPSPEPEPAHKEAFPATSAEPISSPAAATSWAQPEGLAYAEPDSGTNEAERMHQAVERVFDRFKPLLIAAIVRELARRD